jgi:hypothetical protein
MTDKISSWSIRPAIPTDIPFVYSTWLRSYRTGSGLGLQSGKHQYFVLYQMILDQILERESTTVLVAALDEDLSIALGYIVIEPKILHYVFVKEPFRRFGIAKALCHATFNKTTPVMTHMTKIGAQIVGDMQEWKLKPEFIFRRGKNGEGNTGTNDRDSYSN